MINFGNKTEKHVSKKKVRRMKVESLNLMSDTKISFYTKVLLYQSTYLEGDRTTPL